MPFACQIQRGTTGANPKCDQGSNPTPLQVSAATAVKKPKLMVQYPHVLAGLMEQKQRVILRRGCLRSDLFRRIALLAV